MTAFLENEWAVGVVMAVIIFALTYVIKLPIKALTNKIKSERARKIVNGIILLIPFALGLTAECLYCYYFKSLVDFRGITGLGYGTGAVSMYAFVERFFGVKIDNPYNTTEEGKAVQELVDKVQEDGKVDKSDISAVDQFWKTISKEKDKKKK